MTGLLTRRTATKAALRRRHILPRNLIKTVAVPTLLLLLPPLSLETAARHTTANGPRSQALVALPPLPGHHREDTLLRLNSKHGMRLRLHPTVATMVRPRHGPTRGPLLMRRPITSRLHDRGMPRPHLLCHPARRVPGPHLPSNDSPRSMAVAVDRHRLSMEAGATRPVAKITEAGEGLLTMAEEEPPLVAAESGEDRTEAAEGADRSGTAPDLVLHPRRTRGMFLALE